MLAKRVIACLDIKDGSTVNGVSFSDLKEVGNPVALASRYAEEGADELVLIDLSASYEGRKVMVDQVRKIAKVINIPFTVGGGVATVDDVRELLQNGADKVSINSAAVKRPEFITEMAHQFGVQCVVVSIDTRYIDGRWYVYTNGGRNNTGLEALEWAQEVVRLGAGELVVTALDNIGSRDGYDIDLLSRLTAAVSVPIIVSGGAGTETHFADAFCLGQADGALAASAFHNGEICIPQLKYHLAQKGVSVRL